MNSHRSEYRRELYRDREQSYVKHVILRTYLERFAMRFPVVWDSDLRDWLAEWKEAGKIELLDLKPRERAPKLRAGHRIVRKLV
jgi:hypothetical protein